MMGGSVPANVSRETLDDLSSYVELVKKWTPKINLVSKASVVDIWDRHIWDSWQIVDYGPKHIEKWLDLGSGGGFPGILIAIHAKHSNSDQHTCLMEADARKVQFLRTVIRELGLNATVINERIEQACPHQANVVSARALASLTVLLGFAERHLLSGGTLLVHKGSRFQDELNDARLKWSFDCDVWQSKTDKSAAILEIGSIKHVE